MRCNVGYGFLWLPTLALLHLALSGSAFAGMITGVTMFGTEAGTGLGLGTVSVKAILTHSVNNDNVTPPAANDNNIAVPIKRFDFNGIIDIQFLVSSTDGGVTEYKVFESVDNNTGIDWSGYKMTLGFGLGDNFEQSVDDDGLDFDYDEFDSAPVSSIMTSVQKSQDVLEWSGGNHSSGAQSYEFRIDVPDIIGNRLPTFTLRQEPIAAQSPIPEPGSAALALVGGLLMLAWKARFIQA